MKTLIDMALSYEKLGWFVLPAHPIEKRPLVKWKGRRNMRSTPEEIREWWRRFPNARVTVATGACSGFDAVDVDGPEAFEKLMAICGGIPETIYQTTGRDEGGRHLLFKHRELGLRPYQDGVLDLRTTGSIIIVAPSKHKSGRTYTWGKINPIEHGLDDLAEWPPELVQYFRSVSGSNRKKDGQRKPITIDPVPAGKRHQKLTRLVGKWLHDGLDDSTILLAARGWYYALPDRSDFSEDELEKQVKDLCDRYRKEVTKAVQANTEKEKQADALIRIGKTAELFQAPDGTLWARFETNGHFECWPIRSNATGFRRWLVFEYIKETGTTPNPTSIQAAILGLEAEAQYGTLRNKKDVFTRVAKHGGKIYLDMADERWRAIELSPDGWKVVDNPPVCFRRTRGMLPLPEPQLGGSLRLLDGLVNLGGEDNRKTILCWLIYTLNPHGPYPLLCFISEQGSGKSTTAKIIRSIIDPNQAPIRAIPKNLEDLAVAARHSWVLGFDNLGYLPDAISDALCRMATGGGYATRAFYTNDEEAIFWAKRPVILNGITDFIGRPDLLERTLIVKLPPIPPEIRQTETTISEQFERLRPVLLGALLDAAVITLRNMQNVILKESPRMADFAKWSAAAAKAIEADPDEMVSLLFEKQNEALLSDLDSPIPQAVLDLIQQRNGRVELLMSDLLRQLTDIAPEGTTRHNSWPKNPRALKAALARITPVMRLVGVRIADAGKTKKGRKILIEGDGRGPKVTVDGNRVTVDRQHLTDRNHDKGDDRRPKGDDGDGCFPYNSLPLKIEKKEGKTTIEKEAETDNWTKTPSPPSLRHPLDLLGGEL